MRGEEHFDRITGCESLAYTEHKERVRERLAQADEFTWEPVDMVLADGRRVCVLLRADALEMERRDHIPAQVFGMVETERLPGEGYMAWRNRVEMATRTVRVAAVEKLFELRAEMEREQTDARAIDWLKERARLVEQEDGRWVLVTRAVDE